MIQNVNRTSVYNSSIREQRIEPAPFLPHLGIHPGLVVVIGNVAFNETGIGPQFRDQGFPGLFLDVHACNGPAFANQVTG
jgi:hypothetical protein